MNKILANDGGRGEEDFLIQELEKQGKNAPVSIAVAYFTYSDYIKYAVDNGCTVRLIVLLDEGTSAKSLKEIFHLDNVEIRYYSDKFHPKLYIFEDKTVIVGSSNLTGSGLSANAELNISIDSKDPMFAELEGVFLGYWEEAEPLTPEILDAYFIEWDKNRNSNTKRVTSNKIKKVTYPNIMRDTLQSKQSHTLIPSAKPTPELQSRPAIQHQPSEARPKSHRNRYR